MTWRKTVTLTEGMPQSGLFHNQVRKSSPFARIFHAQPDHLMLNFRISPAHPAWPRNDHKNILAWDIVKTISLFSQASVTPNDILIIGCLIRIMA